MAKSDALSTFLANIKDVHRLINIHKNLTDTKSGKRMSREVLNKSAILFITACWEAYIEDLAVEVFNFLLANSSVPDVFPNKVRILASSRLIDEKNKMKVWKLADPGWKTVLEEYRDFILDKYVGKFNTPRPAQIDTLFEKLVGKKGVSKFWYWPKMSSETAKTRLDKYITIRGEIAHRAVTSSAIRKFAVDQYLKFIYRLVVKTNNIMRQYLKNTTGKTPFSLIGFGRVK